MNTLSKGIKKGELRVVVAKRITVGDIFLDHSHVVKVHVTNDVVYIRLADVDKEGKHYNPITIKHLPDHEFVLLTSAQYEKEKKKYGFYVHKYINKENKND